MEKRSKIGEVIAKSVKCTPKRSNFQNIIITKSNLNQIQWICAHFVKKEGRKNVFWDMYMQLLMIVTLFINFGPNWLVTKNNQF